MATSSTRRQWVAGFAALVTLAGTGCGRAAPSSSTERRSPASGPSPEGPRPTLMTVYRDPSCGCCEAWAGLARKAGYQTEVIDRQDMPLIKQRYGVPEQLASCHTTLVGGYVVEGHVPLAAVQRLLAARPSGVKGIAVPGMPIGSPGMEAPDGTKQPFTVLAFDEAGNATEFTT